MQASDTELIFEPRHYEILSSASVAEVRTHVLKHEDTFAVFDTHGDVTPAGNGEQGLYHGGTRFLSRMELWLGHARPVLLSSAVRKDNALLTVNLTNPDLTDGNERLISHGMLHFFRTRLVWKGQCYEHLRIRNFGSEPARIPFAYLYAADYADIFEVRGHRRPRRGSSLPVDVDEHGVRLGYRGLDGITRKTHISFAPAPDDVMETGARFDVELAPQEEFDLYCCVSCYTDSESETLRYGDALRKRRELAESLRADACRVVTADAQFNAWLEQSLQDLNLLLTEVPEGQYPYAGIPWYSTYFGRDGLITALMTLWLNPRIARGVLGYLARTQATELDYDRVAEPGKILHEARFGEMAALNEIPFGRYYGTVDATPLYIVLAGAYERHTGDTAFIETIWPNLLRALEWIDQFGDVDDDGFVEYTAHAEGLTQQGWKDSEDSIFHADGRLAEGPIALVEVQAYVYAARRAMARLARLKGDDSLAREQYARARRLRERFEEAFWCEDLGVYALALDGEKKACRVKTSNAGHVLFTGIADRQRGLRVAETLFESDMYSGWGIRTVSSREVRYNPMSYHNGSVWPHDNALIGLGLARYGCKKRVHQLMNAFFEASLFDPQQRLPELFCGFSRREGEGPTPYPVACSPQAWASVVAFCLLRAAVGLRINADRNEVNFENPSLPSFLPEVRVQNLPVGKSGSVDLVLQRYRRSVGVEILNRRGDVRVTTVK